MQGKNLFISKEKAIHTYKTRDLNKYIFILANMLFIDFPCNYAALYLFASVLCCAIY